METETKNGDGRKNGNREEECRQRGRIETERRMETERKNRDREEEWRQRG